MLKRTETLPMEELKELMELEQIFNGLTTTSDPYKKKLDKLNKTFNKLLEQLEHEKLLDKSRSIRNNQRNKKKNTLIPIHEKNQKTINKLQQEARDEGFFLSKENIVNIGLDLLTKETSVNGVSVVDLFHEYELE